MWGGQGPYKDYRATDGDDVKIGNRFFSTIIPDFYRDLFTLQGLKDTLDVDGHASILEWIDGLQWNLVDK
jgi:hypothetical protein